MEKEQQLAQGAIERVGTVGAAFSYRKGSTACITNEKRTVASHAEAVHLVNECLCSADMGVIESLDEIDGIGYKTVQAGEKNGSVLLTPDVIGAMERYASLAPSHNPAYLNCINYFKSALPDVPMVGVFEPGFHSEIPEHARIFGTPYEWYEQYHVQKYGYHGASFRYVTDHTACAVGIPKEKIRIIACHLGGSSSVCAYRNGRSIDVSMSFTPQSGIVQSDRVGDIDAFVLPYIMERKKISLKEALDELAGRGGLQGISGISGDVRDIVAAADTGNRRAALAIDKFVYDVVRYIGSFYVLMNGVDVIAFSGGIGYNSGRIRSMIVEKIAFLGIDIDEAENAECTEGIKTTKSSKIGVVCVNTNEEIVVARETQRVITAVRA
jgi:acetate kinase